MPRQWWPHNEKVKPEEPCGGCGQSAKIHLGYAPTGGVRFMGMQVAGWNNIDLAVCGGCGRVEEMGTEGRSEALRTGHWVITGRLGLGYVDVNTGKMLRRPLA